MVPRSVLIVDDDEDLTALVEGLVQSRAGYELVGVVSGGEVGVGLAAVVQPDIAIVGCHRGTFDPLDTVAGIRDGSVGVCVVLLADLADPITFLDSLSAGAATVLSSSSGWSELMPTLDLLTGDSLR